MKRSGLKRRGSVMRRAPMRRTPMRRRKGSTSYSRRERDFRFMGWIKSLSCAVLDPGPLWSGPPPDPCQRWIEAHHAGAHGMSNKSADNTTIPLCDHHHDSLPFPGWPRGELRVWQNDRIAHYRALYERRTSADADPIY